MFGGALPVALEVLLSGGLLAVHLLLRIFPDLETVFLLVPGHTMTRPWQVLTAGYCEDALVGLLAGVGVLLAAGHVLARAWGSHELLRFVLLTNAVQASLTWVCMIALYILFREEHFLFVSVRAASNVCPKLHLPQIAAAPRRADITCSLLSSSLHRLVSAASPVFLAVFQSLFFSSATG